MPKKTEVDKKANLKKAFLLLFMKDLK